MARDELTNGSVIVYPFLWSWQQERGETEGRKERETVIVARFRNNDEDLLALLPVTSKAPASDLTAFELPALEVQRLQRHGAARLWVVLSEINIDRAAGSFYLAPDCKVGDLSRAAYRALYEAFIKAAPYAVRIDRAE